MTCCCNTNKHTNTTKLTTIIRGTDWSDIINKDAISVDNLADYQWSCDLLDTVGAVTVMPVKPSVTVTDNGIKVSLNHEQTTQLITGLLSINVTATDSNGNTTSATTGTVEVLRGSTDASPINAPNNEIGNGMIDWEIVTQPEADEDFNSIHN
ncbi:MAG: hypothetical protein KGV56_03200 [Gammaproteobacteria bacterium]|nr:hypothetical protein [Gammaproteobacteria bacterium]